ncbi:unnamed protein product [Linum trigynum]|uniref:Retrotransposon Copia-like N-terminal domain-containing protein n=1 Tax=Linum trigynum TaxID=586398 RepID=A0AAV2GR85_9ROSI
MAEGADSTAGKSIQSSASSSYEDPYLNPYYLPPQDGALSTIISVKLVDGNYHTWSQVMLVALATKNKVAFIDGTIPVPKVTEPSYQLWLRCNGTIRCWIYNSLAEDIANSVMGLESAQAVWENLKNMFSQEDNIRVYDLKGQLAKCVQGEQSISQYFTNITVLWEELKRYRPIPCCPCNTPYETMKKYEDNDFVIKFMQGLNESYQSAKTQVLMNSTLPSIDVVFKQFLQLERQMKSAPKSSGVDSVALAVGSPQNAKHNDRDYKDGKKFCRYCKKDNHIISECYRLKNKKTRESGGSSFAGSVETGSESDSGILGAASVQQDAQNRNNSIGLASLQLSNYQMDKLRILLLGSPQTSPSPPTSPSVRHVANAAVTTQSQTGQHQSGATQYHPVYLPSSSGTTVLSTLLSRTVEPPWVLDTCATDHIICDLKYFLKCKSLQGVFVNLPNGNKVQATHIGIVRLPC